MATFYISPTGSDANPGTEASPWLTFNTSGPKIVAGDTLIARGGNYSQTIAVSNFPNGTNWTTGAVTVKNYPGEIPFIVSPDAASSINFTSKQFHIWIGINIDNINQTVADSSALFLDGGNNIRYQDAEIKNAFWSGISTSQANGQGTFYEFIRLKIHDGARQVAGSPAHGIYFSSTVAQPAGVNLNHLVEECEIYNFTHLSNDSAVQIFGDPDRLGGITIRRSLLRNCSVGTFLTNATTVPIKFHNNIVRNNTNTGIDLFDNLTNAEVYNNTVHSNGDLGISVGTNGLVTDALIKNNSITNNTTISVKIWNTNVSSKATVQFNDFNGNGTNTPLDQNGLSTINSNITTPPGYINAAANNFHLAPGSSNIDAGTTLANVLVDFDNLPRPQGPAYDIGAFEFWLVLDKRVWLPTVLSAWTLAEAESVVVPFYIRYSVFISAAPGGDTSDFFSANTGMSGIANGDIDLC